MPHESVSLFVVFKAETFGLGFDASGRAKTVLSRNLNKRKPKGVSLGLSKFLILGPWLSHQEQPLVAPQVSHFSQVPLRTIVKFWHSEHMLPV
ncbi:hypothetical protein SAMN03159422_00079 [Agrobacterium fabrum]|nr:hypothetical protein [Agrobacterium fabrum]SDB11306.1 hypothetical protein SAMN03159422_00079 [Agrobacterium fabrum]SEQ17726.1 hypothetical protein SAMN03159504_00079 [Agrobacterium fabrum]